MSRSVVYLDASAIVKMVVAEPGSRELRAFLVGVESVTTSVIAAVEVPRAIARYRPDSTA
ncbi:MAG: PIN domain-containing protein, partial [Chloroflexi bacterium]|nr:PIN domain-containing protein [Chloroflexota bacterium]